MAVVLHILCKNYYWSMFIDCVVNCFSFSNYLLLYFWFCISNLYTLILWNSFIDRNVLIVGFLGFCIMCTKLWMGVKFCQIILFIMMRQSNDIYFLNSQVRSFILWVLFSGKAFHVFLFIFYECFIHPLLHGLWLPLRCWI
jgi:hypothetical protein